MKQLIILFTTTIFTFFGIAAVAQISIADDDTNSCDGYLFHGDETGNYQPGMDETITICPEGSETILNLYWTTFGLGDGDKIIIHDGPDTSFPTIELDGQGGATGFTGNSLFLKDITSTSPSGCLTIHFMSDGDDSTGSFTATISCGPPCSKPVPTITVEGEDVSQHILACKDETITFDASSTIFPNNTTFQSVVWNFGDGTTNTTSWPTVDKLFNTPGAYKVTVVVTNNLGCASVYTIPVIVAVATTPIITATSDDYLVCVGQEFNLTGSVAAVPWTATPEIDFGGALFLPDQQGTCFKDTLMVSNFELGKTVTSINDIVSFNVSMEHSYIGDLIISFICPNGSSLVVHQQNGGGTWLGIPCDNDAQPNQAGTPDDYGWSPTATNPTWAQTTGGGYTHSVQDPCSGSGNSLNSGLYSAVGDWNSLIGCPLNGPWVIQVCDNWAIDNGFIFGWSVQFDPELYPEDLSFTPTFGASCDSTYWLGPNIIGGSADCDEAIVVPTDPGNYTYSYVAIDNHGCVYSQPVTVNVYEGPILDAGADFFYCGDETQMVAMVTNPQPGIVYSYSWNNPSYLTAPGNAITNIHANAFNETTEFVLTVYPTTDVNCLIRDTVLAIVPDYPPFAPNDTSRICIGEEGLLWAPTPEGSNYSYQWYYSSDSLGFTMLTNADQALNVSQQGYYTVQVYEPGCHFMSETPYWVEFYSCELTFPNIFTPNGDGKNDMFTIYGITEFPGSSLIIYNRWGKVVYQSAGYNNDWRADGVPEGIYYYITDVKKKTGVESYSGYFHLVRK